MKLSSLPIDMEKVLQGVMLVGDGKMYNDYAEGVKQDTGGYAYDCLAPMLNYEKLMVKIPGKLEPIISYTGKPIPVTFEGVAGKAYQNFRKGGEIELSVMAEKISVADKSSVKLNRGE